MFSIGFLEEWKCESSDFGAAVLQEVEQVENSSEGWRFDPQLTRGDASLGKILNPKVPSGMCTNG